MPLGLHYGDLFSGIVAEHALTRSVRDSAGLLDAIAGPMPGDPYHAPPPSSSFAETMTTTPAPLRIGLQVETPLGDPIDPESAAAARRTAAFSPFTYITNATGQPAISLPMHWTPEGLPVGVQLVARYGEEVLLLQMARQLEVASPWADRRPPDVET